MTYDQWKTASPYDDEEEVSEDCEICEVHLDFCTCQNEDDEDEGED